jgi:hypothetical protein
VKRILSSSFVAMSFFVAAASVTVAQSSSSPDPRVIAGTVNVFVFPASGSPPDSDSDEEDSKFQRAHRNRLDDEGTTNPEIFIRVPAADADRNARERQASGLIGGIAQGASGSPSVASDDGFARGDARTGHGHGKETPKSVSFAGHREIEERCVSLALPLSTAAAAIGRRSSSASSGSAVNAKASVKAKARAKATTE